MSDHVYKHIRLTGSSSESMEAAVNNAIERAAGTVKNMRWFQVIDTRGHVDNGRVAHWQVTLEVGFTLDS
ncbi:MAG: dodecin domain-containing protein [Pseudomonadota bacterium]|nr:MAG: dodecin domain-containing protein [Pseudomonadota bacterium]